jgi:hypothetical protein
MWLGGGLYGREAGACGAADVAAGERGVAAGAGAVGSTAALTGAVCLRTDVPAASSAARPGVAVADQSSSAAMPTSANAHAPPNQRALCFIGN